MNKSILYQYFFLHKNNLLPCKYNCYIRIVFTYSTELHYSLLLQKTATKAVVEMCEGDEGLGDGFQLLIGLAEIHVPRMWVEENN